MFVALKPIVEAMGLAWQGQLERVKRHPILREGISVMLIPTPSGPQNTVGLRLNLVPGWLFTIVTSRLKEVELRKKVELFQRECFELLWAHFSGETKAVADPKAAAEYERRSLNLVEEARLTFGNVVAQRLWIVRGLTYVSEMDRVMRPLDLFDRPAA